VVVLREPLWARGRTPASLPRAWQQALARVFTWRPACYEYGRVVRLLVHVSFALYFLKWGSLTLSAQNYVYGLFPLFA
jgi:hypothetical protein